MVSGGHVGALLLSLPRAAAKRGRGGPGGGEEKPRREREELEMLPALPGSRSLCRRHPSEPPRARICAPGQRGCRGPVRRARSG